MPKEAYIGLDTDAVLAKVFADWKFKNFTFPGKDEPDGCVGKKCISKAYKIVLRRRAPDNTWKAYPDKTQGLLSGHLYFKASCGMVKKSTQRMKLTVHELHFTVRRSKSQFLIDDAGPSSLTSAESIHINRNTSWGREQNLKALARALANDLPSLDPAFTAEEISLFLTDCLKATQDTMKTLATEFEDAVVKRFQTSVGVDVELEGDASITGR